MYKKFFCYVFLTFSFLSLSSSAMEASPEGLPRIGVPRTVLPESPLELEEVRKFCEDCASKYPGQSVFEQKNFTIFSIIDTAARRLSGGEVTPALHNFISKQISNMKESLFRATSKITSTQYIVFSFGTPSRPTVSHDVLFQTLSKMTGVLAYCLTRTYTENCREEEGFMGQYCVDDCNLNFYYIRTAFGYLPVLKQPRTYGTISTGYAIDRDILRVKNNSIEEDSLEILLDEDQKIICQSGILFGIEAQLKGLSSHCTFSVYLRQFAGAYGAAPFECLESYETPLFYTDSSNMLGTLFAKDDHSNFMPFISWYFQGIKDGTITSEIKDLIPCIGKLYYPTFLPLPSKQRELIEFADYIRGALGSEDPAEQAQALNFVRLIEDADEEEEVSLEEAKALMDQVTPESFSGLLLESSETAEAERVTAESVPSTTLSVDGESIAKRKEEKARKRAERTATSGGGVGFAGGAPSAGAGPEAGVGAGAGAGAGGDASPEVLDPEIEKRLGKVKTWKNALSFLNRFGLERKSQRGSHPSFEDRSGATLHVAMPHTDKAKTHFAKRFVQKIGSLIKGQK
jgi:hypothetical protein